MPKPITLSLVADFSSDASFVQQHTAPVTIPLVGINGRAPKAFYFQMR